MAKASRVDAARTRAEILRRGADLASVEGLSGLTVGRLASALGLSKSGVFAHFGSKDDLDLAVVEAAREQFERDVLAGPESAGGFGELVALAGRWLGYMERSPFRGGCFFAAIAAEVDDRPGRVRDRVSELVSDWTGLLAAAAARAIDEGDLEDCDPAEIAFEIHAFLQEANRSFQLLGDAEAFGRAARAIRRGIASRATDRGRAVLEAAES